MKKMISYVIGGLLGLVLLLGTALGVFVKPLFQADVMLARIRVDEVVEGNCYLVSLEVQPNGEESERDLLITRQPLCGDFLGLGYEFALPDKSFALMKKPGIVITNLVGFDAKTRNMKGNIPVGSYSIEFVESFRSMVTGLLRKTPMFKSITYDIRALMETPTKGAVITYKLEPLRQQVIVECEGCQK